MLDLRYRTILSVALPLMGSTFIQSVVLLTDSSFLSRYDIEAFDAAGNAGLIYISLFMAMAGMNEGVQILMARRIGEKRESELSDIFGSALSINLLLALLLFAISQLVIPGIIVNNVESSSLGLAQIEYIDIRSYGFFPSILTLAINAYYAAKGRTIMVLISSAIMACSNIFLDYALIFGNFEFPELGLRGAAWASTLSECIGALFLVLSLIVGMSHRKTYLKGSIPTIIYIKRLFKISSPIMLQGIAALTTWTVFFFWIEQIGKFELTVSQNIRSLYFLAFVPIWGFAATTKTYVSQYLGGNQPEKVGTIIRKIQLLTFVFLLAFFHGAVLYPKQLISIINPDPEFLDKSADTLAFVFGSMILYGFFSVYLSTISGSGNTRYAFYVELISVVAYIATAYLFIKIFQWDIFWVWSVEYVYFGVIGVLSFSYLRMFNWNKKVI